MLMEQSRPQQALEQLQLHLADSPDDPLAYVHQARCFADLDQFDDATKAAQTAIRLAPDSSAAHHALAVVWLMRKRYREAEAAIDEAIRLNPDDADHFAVQSLIYMSLRQWAKSLAAAEEGLKIDPEHPECNNWRAMMLTQLGRREEAGQTIEATLARDPDNAFTHANQGWSLLQQGQPQQALSHFRESLRIDPTCDWSRQGIVESLKARNIVYRLMLNYFFWMSRLPVSYQFGVLLFGLFGVRFLLELGEKHPAWMVWIMPVVIVYVAFALLTWIADPLFNLLLRLDKHGRYALSNEQIHAANALGVCLTVAIGCLVGYAATGNDQALSFAWLFGLGLIPLTSIWRCQEGWPRQTMLAFTAAFFLTGILVRAPVPAAVALPAGTLHLMAIYAAPWLANGLQFARVTR